MGKATLAHQRAIGEIGVARAARLTEAGLVVLYLDEYQKLKERVADLEKQNKLLRDIAQDSVETSSIAAQVLKEALGR